MHFSQVVLPMGPLCTLVHRAATSQIIMKMVYSQVKTVFMWVCVFFVGSKFKEKIFRSLSVYVCLRLCDHVCACMHMRYRLRQPPTECSLITENWWKSWANGDKHGDRAEQVEKHGERNVWRLYWFGETGHMDIKVIFGIIEVKSMYKRLVNKSK